MAGQEHYWEAFYRLKNGIPRILHKGSKINLDNVALEAGRKRGAIKKSRKSQAELVAAINNADLQIADSQRHLLRKLGNETQKAVDYKAQYHQLLNHTIMQDLKIREQSRTISKLMGH